MTKMQISEATLTPLLVGNRNGANSKTARIASIRPLSSMPPGGLSETSQPSQVSRRLLSSSGCVNAAASPPCGSAPGTALDEGAIVAASMMRGEREQAARSPQQDQRHQQ